MSGRGLWRALGVVMLLAALAAASGCGRRGPPVAPSGAGEEYEAEEEYQDEYRDEYRDEYPDEDG